MRSQTVANDLRVATGPKGKNWSEGDSPMDAFELRIASPGPLAPWNWRMAAVIQSEVGDMALGAEPSG